MAVPVDEYESVEVRRRSLTLDGQHSCSSLVDTAVVNDGLDCLKVVRYQ